MGPFKEAHGFGLTGVVPIAALAFLSVCFSAQGQDAPLPRVTADSTVSWKITALDGSVYYGIIQEQTDTHIRLRENTQGVLQIARDQIARMVVVNPEDLLDMWRIATSDGNVYWGNVVDQSDEYVQLQTDHLGVLTIPVDQIRSMATVDERHVVEGELWEDHLQATRYFWAPSGFGLQPGEGYYQNVWVFFNQFAFGVGANTSLGIGLIPIFMFGGEQTPIWVTPKISVPFNENETGGSVGIGALAGTILGGADATFGIVYGTLTAGSRNKNVSVGLGYGFAEGQWAEKPSLSFSAMLRGGRRAYFLTENYYVDGYGVITFGGRLVGRNMSFDYGLVIPVDPELGVEFAFPWIGIIVPFGEQ